MKLSQSLATITFGMAFFNAMAGTMGATCSPLDVSTPCSSTGWEAGITALYVKPYEDGDFGTRAVRVNGNIERDLDWDHKNDWGFRLDGAWHYGMGADVALNWTHLPAKTEGRYVRPDRRFIHRIDWDSVNAEVGQRVDLSARSNLRYFGGAQYLRTYASIDNFAGNVFLANAHSTFNGVGPRVGLDLSHDLHPMLNVYAKTAGSLLYGSSSYVDNLGFRTGSKKAMVPELEGRLGANLHRATGRGVFALDGGVLWVNYFNNLYNTVGAVTGINGLESDFGFVGPYLGLKYTA